MDTGEVLSPEPVLDFLDEPKTPVQSDSADGIDLLALSRSKLADWREKLDSNGLTQYDLSLHGSICLGFSPTFRPRAYSFNPRLGKNIDSVLEIDILLTGPATIWPLKCFSRSRICRLLELDYSRTETLDRWSRPTRTDFLYAYDCVGGNRAIEWEVIFVEQPFLNIIPYWRMVFTPEEIEWQLSRRKEFLSYGPDTVDDYRILKSLQSWECRRRVVMAFALNEVKQDVLLACGFSREELELPLSDRIPVSLRPVVMSWLAADFSERLVNSPVMPLLPDSKPPGTFSASDLEWEPEPPSWVTCGERVLRHLSLINKARLSLQ